MATIELKKLQLLPTNNRYWIAVSVIICVLMLAVFSVNIPERFSKIHIETYHYSDNERDKKITDIVKLSDSLFTPLSTTSIGYSEHVHWFRVEFGDATARADLLEVGYGLLDNVDVWFVDTDDNMVVEYYSTGDKRPFQQRTIVHQNFIFPVPQHYGKVNAYLKIESDGPIKVPISAWQYPDFIAHTGAKELFVGMFFGYMIAMGICNFFVFVTTRSALFGIYVCYVFSFAMVIATLLGLGFRFFWPDNIWLQERAIILFACVTLVFIIEFTIQILQIQKHSSQISLTMRVLQYLSGMLLLASIIVPYEYMIKAVVLMMSVISPVILFAGVFLSFKGHLVARYFSAAWTVLLLSGLVSAADTYGVQLLQMESIYILMIGAVLETMLLVLALAINVNAQNQKTERTMAIALENERKALAARDELARVKQEAEQALEYKVEERTYELEITLRELSEANRELERVSSLDPLTNLMNRRFFEKRLLAEVRRSRRERTFLSFAILDIDFFKRINDDYGHLAGDHCLKAFAQLLTQSIQRPGDVICRYGGEEFVVVLPDTEFEGANILMEKVRAAVAASVTLFEGRELMFTVSIGLSTKIIDSEEDSELLFSYTDKLLYRAKAQGRNQIVAQKL